MVNEEDGAAAADDDEELETDIIDSS